MTSNIHTQLLELLRNHPKFQDEEFNSFFTLEDDALCRFLFLNYRTTKTKKRGLRLTNQGLRLFSSLYKGWSMPIDEEFDFSNRWLIILDRECTMPYYLAMKDRELVVFEEEIGVMLKLNGGNIDMIENMWTKPKEI